MTLSEQLHLIDTGETQYGRAVFEVARPFLYRSTWLDPTQTNPRRINVVVRVPKGFRTDFASIPCVFWICLPPTGPWRQAAVIHDYLCTLGYPRFLTDAIFRHIMEENRQVHTWQRLLIYYSVRTYWVLLGRWLPCRKGPQGNYEHGPSVTGPSNERDVRDEPTL